MLKRYIKKIIRASNVMAPLEKRLSIMDAMLLEMDGRLDPVESGLDRLQMSLVENLVENTFNQTARRSPAASRSVLFLHQSYYHFLYLAEALRKRGWNAQVVDFDNPDSTWNKYNHGADAHFYSQDPVIQEAFGRSVFEYAKRHFEMVHFAGDGLFSFSSSGFGLEPGSDLLEWKKLGKKIGYSISGCNSGVSKQTVAEWSLLDGRNVCDTCIWNDREDVCSPESSLRWGQSISKYCDLVCGEMAPALDAIASPNVILEPLTMCVDPELWSPDLVLPPNVKVLRETPEEVLVYHGVGEIESRSDERRNIKGTPAIRKAVDRLRSEGLSVRLVFVTGVPNIMIPYYQSQADIIVDQLNYGRYGAQSREGMMLGKAVVCYLNRYETLPGFSNNALDECPLISATEESVYEVLKELVLDEAKRIKIGLDCRDFALKWHHPDRCAERYERAYDKLQLGHCVSGREST